jgi:uncharacterized protein
MTIHVVLDTNVLLSGLAYPASVPGSIVAAWRGGSLRVSLSHYILDELRRVLPKLRARHGLSDDGIADLVDCLAFQADLAEPAAHWNEQLTDPFDQAILGTLVAAQADYLITGDKALLALADKYPVLSAAQFWQRHGAV